MSDDRIVVFAGPSLPPASRPDGPFEWRPPAASGDVLALLSDAPARLCLIDGLFDACPAPWHKELLVLMARGTLVFGAASMGALRAAELDGFGMIGVGSIYRAFRDGRVHGDDEVALIHATEALGWAPLSVPMIELRATLWKACRERIITPALARRVRALARDIHFADRDWPAIAGACAGIAAAGTLGQLERMHVPLKRRDAVDCLDAARRWAGPPIRTNQPPLTAFIRQLAADRGVALEARSVVERGFDAFEESPGELRGKRMVAQYPR